MIEDNKKLLEENIELSKQLEIEKEQHTKCIEDNAKYLQQCEELLAENEVNIQQNTKLM